MAKKAGYHNKKSGAMTDDQKSVCELRTELKMPCKDCIYHEICIEQEKEHHVDSTMEGKKPL